MNKSVIALLLLTSAAAFANEATDDQANRAAAASQASHSEVKAALAQARSAGQVGAHADLAAYFETAPKGAVRSREDVRAEAARAARTPVIDPLI